MKAMVFNGQDSFLHLEDVPIPEPKDHQILVRVSCCAVCRTDLHVIEGDLKQPVLPLILGHEIVGYVEKIGKDVLGYALGDKVGVPWLGFTCGSCIFCTSEQENLCENAQFTGYQINGGYAEYTVVNARYCFHLPENYDDLSLAPLLCAGLIGYRSYFMALPAKKIGLYGFGAAAHIIAQIAIQEGRDIFAFTREGDTATQNFARSITHAWVGDSRHAPPEQLDAAIVFAPDGQLVPEALKHIRPGGKVVCAGIHMSDIPSFPYEWLWKERSILSVANLTRQDGLSFFELITAFPVTIHTTAYPLEDANKAIHDLRNGRIEGAAVLKIL